MSESTDQYALPADFSDRVFGVLLAAADGATHARDGQEPGESETLALYLLDGLLEALEWAQQGVASDEAACMWLGGLRWYKLVTGSFPEDSPRPLPRWIDEAFAGSGNFAPGDTQNLLALANPDMATVGRPAFREADSAGVLTRAALVALLPRVDEDTTRRIAVDASALTHGSPAAHRAAGQAALVIRAALESGTDSIPTWAPLVADLGGEAGAALQLAVGFVAEGLALTDPKAAYDCVFEALGEEPDTDTAAFAAMLLAAVQGTDAVAHRPASVLDAVLDAMHDRWVALTVGQ